MMIKGPILAAIPMEYSDGDAFWARDMGLIVRGIRSLGMDARLVAFGRRENHAPDLPLILGNQDDFLNPQWWQSLSPWGIVLNTWSAPRYNGIRRAALSATPRIIEKLDTDGVRSTRIWLRQCYIGSLILYRDANSPLQNFLAPALAAGKILLSHYWIDKKIAQAMNTMPMLAAESPIAAERIRRLMRLHYNSIPQVVCIPHPVAEDYMRAETSAPRQNRIVSVGRWHAYRKNFPMLLTVLEKFLKLHPHWEADIIGRLPEGWQPGSQFSGMISGKRIRFHNFMAHEEISSVLRKSKIFFMPSRGESFNIAAAEALCCGCSVVSSADIASVPYFVSESSGTIACRQHKNHFLDALGAEADAWETGMRNPEAISDKWIKLVGSTAVGRKVVTSLESIPD